MSAPTPDAGWRSFESCSRKQLLTTCYALEDMRDRAITRAGDAEERIEKARAACVSLGHLAQGVLCALDGDQAQRAAAKVSCPSCGLDLSDECPDCRERGEGS